MKEGSVLDLALLFLLTGGYLKVKHSHTHLILHEVIIFHHKDILFLHLFSPYLLAAAA